MSMEISKELKEKLINTSNKIKSAKIPILGNMINIVVETFESIYNAIEKLEKKIEERTRE